MVWSGVFSIMTRKEKKAMWKGMAWCLLGSLLLTLVGTINSDEKYPTRPIDIIVSFFSRKAQKKQQFDRSNPSGISIEGMACSLNVVTVWVILCQPVLSLIDQIRMDIYS